MKKKVLWILALALGYTMATQAQEYKLAKSSGKLVIKEVNSVEIEGYSGNEIIFSPEDGAREKDKRAEGLRAVSSMGLEDNTGLGLSVQEKGNAIEVYQLKKMGGPRVKIQVPKGVSISYSHTSPYGSDFKVKNVESEIEISTLHNGATLENVTGPMTVKTIHGKIETVFSAAMKAPISIVSVHGLVDVTIPAAAKANVNLSTNYGEMFVDPSIKLEFEGKDEWTRYGSNKVEGKMNGGGLDITLSSTHGNIYLRKK